MIIGIMFIAVIYYVHGVKRYITRNIHVTLFVTIALLGILPGLHWYYLHGGWSNQFVQHFFPKLLILYAILGIGVLAYLTKFPERFFPGSSFDDALQMISFSRCYAGYFDILFSSHQLWHLASLAAFIYWYKNGIELLQYRLINPCDSQSK
jgi:predicted membrane channel-forming protein YqfA (hemolysin III family)